MEMPSEVKLAGAFLCVHGGGQPRIYTHACVRFSFRERASARLTLTSCWQQFFGKVGARGRYSSPSVWPPPPGTQTQISRGTTCCGGKASAQTKPLNILSKSIKAPRDWLGLIVCVRYYRGHHPRQKLETALRKSWRRKKTATLQSPVSSPQRGKVAEERFILVEKLVAISFQP